MNRQRKLKNTQAATIVQPEYRIRRHLVLGLILLVASLLIMAAWYQQVSRTDFLQKKGDMKHLSRISLSAQRGRILDRNGEILAISTPVDSVWADPRWLKQDSQTIRALAAVLKQDPDELRQKLARYSKKQFVYLDRWLSPEDAQRVMQVVESAEIRGVHRKREYKRYYPAGEVFAHVVGFAGLDDEGQEGVELLYEEALAPVDGEQLVRRDAKRRLLEGVEVLREARSGQDIELSLDRRLQYFSYRALKRAIKKYRANSASLVLLDVRTGEVLAMVNQPSFNPNGSRSNKGGRLRNRAVVDTFEPGSTMKPVTVSSAMQLGLINPETSIDATVNGVIKVGANVIKDPRPYGALDPAGVLRKSSNVGAASIALRMDKENYWRMLDAFGFGQTPGIGFPGESGGYLPDYNQWAEIDHANMAFGYGISVSALQLAQAYAVIAADGVKRPVTLFKQKSAPYEERVLNASVARDVRRMMEAVATPEGTAPDAAIPGYRVAGKTGTVKKVGKNGYTEKRYRALFAGMVPASSPRLVMVAVFEEPQGKQYYGGQVAGPVFAEVMEHAVRLMNIAPDGDEPRSPLQLLAAGSGQ